MCLGENQKLHESVYCVVIDLFRFEMIRFKFNQFMIDNTHFRAEKHAIICFWEIKGALLNFKSGRTF